MTAPPFLIQAFETFFLHVVPVWISYIARWRLLPPVTPALLPVLATVRLGLTKLYLPWAAGYLLLLLGKPYTPGIHGLDTLMDW